MNGLNFLGHRETPTPEGNRMREAMKSQRVSLQQQNHQENIIVVLPLNLRMIQICMLRDFREYYISDIKYETLIFFKKSLNFHS